MTPVAVVGMACRFPDAATPAQLFDNVMDRRRAFRRMPAERLAPAYARGDSVDTTYIERAGVLTGWEFPRADYGVSRALFQSSDLTHWLALQVADEALADSGYVGGDGLARDRVGVVLGNTLTGEFTRASQLRLRVPFLADRLASVLAANDVDADLAAELVAGFSDEVRSHFPAPDDNSLAGALANTIAGRICNHFDFNGLGYTVDGACSSSLLSVEIAVRALASGQLDFALAGGVDLSLDPFELVGFARLGALAHGEMRVYDADPTGFIPGEGCGVLALMRADDAARAGRRVYARIDGVGVSSDGSGGLTRPAVAGQLLAHERAYEMAGYGPDEVELVEGHGTGTAVGDAVELGVLRTLRDGGRTRAQLGSVKANIGHTKAAAGSAGLIKAVMSVHRGVRPPNTGCDRPHELLGEAGPTLTASRHADGFDRDVARASVSALGFGGINCTVLVSGDRRRASTRRRRPTDITRPAPDHEVLVVCASSRSELRRELDRVGTTAARLSDGELRDLAHHLATAGDHRLRYRACVVTSDPWDAATAFDRARHLLDDWNGVDLTLDRTAGVALGAGPPARVALVFPGQAAPVRVDAPAWATVLDEVATLVAADPPAASAVDDGVPDTAVAQPAIVRQSLFALAWLDAMGCDAEVAIGHSLGEISALAWAGALDPSAALALATERGRLMSTLGRPGTTMASVVAPLDVVEVLLAATDAEIAAINSPTNVVVSGPVETIDVVADRAGASGVAVHRLDVSHGFHSRAMAPVRPAFEAVLRGADLGPTDRSYLSTVTGGPVADGADVRPLLVHQLTEPVRFQECVDSVATDVDLFVEVGPGEMMTGLVRACGFGGVATTIDAGGDDRQLALTAAVLVAGGAASPDHWFAGRPHRAFDPERSRNVLANPCESNPDPVPAGDRTPSTARAVDRTSSSSSAAVTEGDDVDTLTCVRRRIAAVMDLEPAAIDPAASLLADLHLTSLEAVEIAEALVVACGRAMPMTPLSVATASVGELAALIDELPDADESATTAAVGVDTWVRLYTHRPAPWTPRPRTEPTEWTEWHVGPDAPDPTPIARRSDAETGVVVRIDEHAGPAAIATTASRLAADPPDLVVVARAGTGRLHPSAAGLGRALSAELPGTGVTVLSGAVDATPVSRSVATRHGYLELDGTDDGLLRPLTVAHDPAVPDEPVDAVPALVPGDVCLVTGGLDGITMQCAIALARRTGAHLVAVGRSGPDTDRVRTALDRLPDDLMVRYVCGDVTDPAVAADVVRAAGESGPVRGIVHGAAVNEPARLTDLTAESLTAHVAPKVDGLSNLLDAIEAEPALLVTFGSVIGRCGLEGEGAYCIANDWLRRVVEAWADEHPSCRTRNIEWSVWSGAGMAVRLGVVDRLARAGVAAIPPELGVGAFLDAIVDPDLPTTVTVSGRFPPSPRLWQDDLDRPLLERFQEQVVEYSPAVELITQPTIDLTSDPYLDDHRPVGDPLFPGVVGLEAMTQVAAGCLPAVPAGSGWTIESVELAAPVGLGDEGRAELQIAALARGESSEVRLRSSADRFATDRFRATVTPLAAPIDPGPNDPDPDPRGEPSETTPSVDADATAALYGSLFFHGPRFRVVDRYDELSAHDLVARLRPPATAPQRWFSDFHSQHLLLGSPALTDGLVHVLMACLPSVQAVPVGVDRIDVFEPIDGELCVCARQVSSDDGEYEFDVTASADDGRPVSTWHGLRLRAIGERTWDGDRLPEALLAPWASRRLEAMGWPWPVHLRARPHPAGAADPGEGSARHDDRRSRSHRAGSVLEASADVRVAVDWEAVVAGASDQRLGESGVDLATSLVDDHGVDVDLAIAFVWSARETLVKLGESPDTRLTVKLTDDRDVWLEGERVAIGCLAADVVDAPETIVIAVAVAP